MNGNKNKCLILTPLFKIPESKIIDDFINLYDFHMAALAHPKGAWPWYKPPTFSRIFSVGGLVRRASTHRLSARGCRVMRLCFRKCNSRQSVTQMKRSYRRYELHGSSAKPCGRLRLSGYNHLLINNIIILIINLYINIL